MITLNLFLEYKCSKKSRNALYIIRQKGVIHKHFAPKMDKKLLMIIPNTGKYSILMSIADSSNYIILVSITAQPSSVPKLLSPNPLAKLESVLMSHNKVLNSQTYLKNKCFSHKSSFSSYIIIQPCIFRL